MTTLMTTVVINVFVIATNAPRNGMIGAIRRRAKVKPIARESVTPFVNTNANNLFKSSTSGDTRRSLRESGNTTTRSLVLTIARSVSRNHTNVVVTRSTTKLRNKINLSPVCDRFIFCNRLDDDRSLLLFISTSILFLRSIFISTVIFVTL